jgi:hypothetical protein
MPSTTISYTAQVGQNFAYSLGKVWNLKDAQGAPRSATGAECKDYLRAVAKQLITDVMGKEAQDAALAAVQLPEADFT